MTGVTRVVLSVRPDLCILCTCQIASSLSPTICKVYHTSTAVYM